MALTTGAELVSVIIPTYHRPQGLRRTVETILTQDLPIGIAVEVVIAVSDAQAQDDVAIAEELAADPRVKVIVADRGGPAAARNAGIRAATGALLAFIDDDCEAQPGWLEAGLAAMKGADFCAGAHATDWSPGEI